MAAPTGAVRRRRRWPRLSRWIHTWRAKLLLLLLGFAIVPLMAQALWDYLATRRAFETSTLEAMEGLAHAKAQALEQLTSDRKTQVERIAGLLTPRVRALATAADVGAIPRSRAPGELPVLRDAEALPTSGPAAPSQSDEAEPKGYSAPPEPLLQLREALALLLWDQRQFEELLVIDPRGRVVASTHKEHEGHDAEALAYFRGGLGVTYVQPVFLSPLTHRLTLVIATPIRDSERGVQGVLAARLNLESLFQVVTETTGLGETGETVVARRDDERVVFVAPTRFDPRAALQRSLRVGDPRGRPIEEAIAGRSGRARAHDYRRRDVLAAWEQVPSLDWGLMVKIDRSEALRPAVDAGLRALALAIPLVLGVFAVSWLASRALVQPLVELRAAADRISRGDLDVALDIRSRDEVGELTDSFDRMVAAIRFFREHTRAEDEEPVE